MRRLEEQKADYRDLTVTFRTRVAELGTKLSMIGEFKSGNKAVKQAVLTEIPSHKATMLDVQTLRWELMEWFHAEGWKEISKGKDHD